MEVPRVLMQTWKTKDVPLKWKPSVKSIKEKLKDWRHILMTDIDNVNFVQTYFPDYLNMFQKFKYPIQRADTIRYMWLYVNGGVYMDLDYIVNKSFESLFYKRRGPIFITSSNFNSSLTNSFMASTPKETIWLDILTEIKKRQSKGIEWWARGKHFEVMMTTGPGVVDKVVKNSHHIYTIFPSKLINPYNICDKIFDKDSYLTPLEGCSWGDTDTKIGNWVYCHSNETLFFTITLILLIIATIIYYFYCRKN